MRLARRVERALGDDGSIEAFHYEPQSAVICVQDNQFYSGT